MTYTGIGSRQKPSLRHEWKAERKKAAMLWGGGQRSCCRERDGTEGSEGRGQPHTHRLGGFDEHFAPPQLELVTVHVDRLQQVEDTLFLISFPRRPGGFGQNGISVRTIGERRIRLRLD